MKLHEFQKMLRDEGFTPAQVNEIARAKHQAKIDDEIAAGKWRCPTCRQAMRRKPNTTILFCPEEH